MRVLETRQRLLGVDYLDMIISISYLILIYRL